MKYINLDIHEFNNKLNNIATSSKEFDEFVNFSDFSKNQIDK
jgi:hypothetical protein